MNISKSSIVLAGLITLVIGQVTWFRLGLSKVKILVYRPYLNTKLRNGKLCFVYDHIFFDATLSLQAICDLKLRFATLFGPRLFKSVFKCPWIFWYWSMAFLVMPCNLVVSQEINHGYQCKRWIVFLFPILYI